MPVTESSILTVLRERAELNPNSAALRLLIISRTGSA